MKRAFSMLLALCLVLSLLPFGTFAASSGTTAAGQTAAGTTAAADATTYLAFSSDAHNSGDNQSANRLDQWITNVTAKVGDDIDVMSYCGDYGNASANESNFWTYAEAIMNTTRNHARVHDSVFSTGNHEYYNGRYGSTTNAVAENITRIGEARNASNYIIYCFGPRDGNGDRYDTEDLGILDSYLGSLPAADREKPIFILTHYPAHTASGSSIWGWSMSRSTTNADQLISTLNKYGEQGYDIYYLWGHNHTVSDTHYDEVYTGTLDGTEIKFTYLAAGCMSYRDYSDGSAYVKGKGLLVGIDDAGEVVSMNYYDANANDVTENASGSETPAPTTQPTTEPTVQPTEIVSDVAVTPSTGNPTVSATIEVGDTLTIAVTNGSTSNAYDFTASLSGSGVAELQGSSTVNIATGATAAFTVTGLAPGTVDITIQNENAYSSQYTRKATIHLTVVSGGTTPTPEPTAEPTVEPTTEPVVVSEVSVTPTTSNPAESATIHVGDTLAIRVTNSSSYSDYDFTASLSAGGVAQLQGDATINVARSATGSFTVTGLAPGSVDINIQNDNGTYTRKATIHLTVVSGGTTPIECDHPDIDVVGEKAPTCTEDGYNGDLVCTVCGEILETGESIPALGHTVERRNASEATCTTVGYSGDDVCTRCGETVAWGYELPALGHDWSDWVTEGNTSTRTCARCGETESEQLPDPGSNTFVRVSELADGQEYLIVNVNDGAGYALVNNNGSVSAVDVTVSGGRIVLDNDAAVWACGTNSKGFTLSNSGRWLNCDYSAGLQIASSFSSNRAWSYGSEQLKMSGSSSTYTLYYNNGFQSSRSSNSGKIYLFARSAAECAHEDVVLTGAAAATCTEPGYTGDQVCAVCGETVVTGEVIPALGHTTELRNVRAATCTEAGYTGDQVCTVCGETVAAGEAISALGHSWDEGVVTQQPTASAEGVKTFTCLRCGETRTESVPKLTNPFKDVPAGKYYTDAVLWAVNQEPQITNGYADGTFRPDQVCTRAQVVTFLWRAAGEPAPTRTDNPFKDVSASAYYYQAVLWALENGITTGYADGTFRPNDECTRAQVVTFLWRAQGSPTPERTDNPFKDVSASAYYAKAVLWALENGVTTGNSATTFNPDGACTRAHVVTFLCRANAE